MPLEAGSIADGTVTKLTHYGIFVNLPENESGLVHISEIADAFVRDVADYFQVGDQVKVKVLNIDDRGRYELSAKQAEARQPINPDAPTTPRRRVMRSSPQFDPSAPSAPGSSPRCSPGQPIQPDASPSRPPTQRQADVPKSSKDGEDIETKEFGFTDVETQCDRGAMGAGTRPTFGITCSSTRKSGM